MWGKASGGGEVAENYKPLCTAFPACLVTLLRFAFFPCPLAKPENGSETIGGMGLDGLFAFGIEISFSYRPFLDVIVADLFLGRERLTCHALDRRLLGFWGECWCSQLRGAGPAFQPNRSIFNRCRFRFFPCVLLNIVLKIVLKEKNRL